MIEALPKSVNQLILSEAEDSKDVLTRVRRALPVGKNLGLIFYCLGDIPFQGLVEQIESHRADCVSRALLCLLGVFDFWLWVALVLEASALDFLVARGIKFVF